MNAELTSCDILVIGAGPAGLEAALTARRAGADVICVDTFPRSGGQFYMQPMGGTGPFAASRQARVGAVAEAACAKSGVRLLVDTEIFWVEPGFTAFARRGEGALAIRTRLVIVATGAMERAMPFKGWTLPGVITAGAAQRLIKANGAVPGRKVVLAGTGAFLMAVGAAFGKAGLRLADFVEMTGLDPRAALMLIRHPSNIPDTLRIVADMARALPRVHLRSVVTEAIGTSRVEAVRIAPLDHDGHPLHERSRVIKDIDCLCIGYGFRPITDVTSLLQAEHTYDSLLGGWICRADESQRTSVAGLYAAGETTGIGGAKPALLSGRLAAFGALRELGRTIDDGEVARTRRALARARSFAHDLARLYPYPSQLIGDFGPDVRICRCEDVRRSAVDKAIAEGAGDVFSVKMWTRAGMGPCQGRTCGAALGELVAKRLGHPVEAGGCNRPHLPIRPVPIDIADAALGLTADHS